VLSLGISLWTAFLGSIFLVVTYNFIKSEKIGFRSIQHFMTLWLALIFYFCFSTWINWNGTGLKAIVAELDNFFEPFIVMFACYLLLEKKTKLQMEERFEKVAKTLVGFLIVNTFLSLISIFFNVNTIESTVGLVGKYFWGGENSVAVAAMQNGRYSGVFNQPFEAGIAYTLGVLAWIYIVRNRKIKSIELISILVLFLGGIFTISKAFIFVGILVFSIVFLSIKNLRNQAKLVVPFLIISLPTVMFLLRKPWGLGLQYFLRFIRVDSYENGALNLFTAGRFGGNNATQTKAFERVITQDSSAFYHKVIGNGFGTQAMYDDTSFHFFSVGGIIGILFLACILVLLIAKSILFIKRSNFSVESKLFAGIVLMILLDCFGGPIFTVNRSSSILWLMILMLLQFYDESQQNGISKIRDFFR
jgi:hypothetical protein